MAEDGKNDSLIPRKARIVGLHKMYSQFYRLILAPYSLTIFKAVFFPSVFYYALYHTEPRPTVLELFNPFV